MSSLRYLAGSLVLMAAALAAAPAEAAFHLWFIKEVYSNHDGSVQFIELFTTTGAQNQTSGEQIVTGSGNTYTFGGNVVGNTANRHLLLATSTYDAVPNSPAPNFAAFPLPQNFFDPGGDTIEFVGADFKSFASIPIDGFSSRNWPSFGNGGTTIAHNTPTNFTGTSGHIVLPPPPSNNGDYNEDGFVDAADYSYWRKFVGAGASPAGSGADGDSDGTVEDPDDYNYWRQRFGTVIPGSSSGPIPEPAAIVLSLAAWVVLSFARGRRS